jgi:hypothetical protein
MNSLIRSLQFAHAKATRWGVLAILSVASATSAHAQALFADGFEGNCGAGKRFAFDRHSSGTLGKESRLATLSAKQTLRL